VEPGEVEIDHGAREVTMSMIFKWYKADFGPPDVMLPWLLQVRLISCPACGLATGSRSTLSPEEIFGHCMD
jgi:hypothetical protein